MCHSQFFQMVNAGCQLVGTYRSLFCQCQELSFMLNTRRRVDGHITMVHFIKNHIGRIEANAGRLSSAHPSGPWISCR